MRKDAFKAGRLCGGCAELRSGAACDGGAVTLGEFIDATGGIDEALLTGEERMATGADADADVLRCGLGVINRAAGAGDGGFVNRWMTFFFHGDGWVVTWTRRGRGFSRGVGAAIVPRTGGGSNGFFGVWTGQGRTKFE